MQKVFDALSLKFERSGSETRHLHLVPRLGACGATPHLSILTIA
jgi:hypothetical protein